MDDDGRRQEEGESSENRKLIRERYFKLLEEWVILQNALQARALLAALSPPNTNTPQAANTQRPQQPQQQQQQQQQQQENRPNLQNRRRADNTVRASELTIAPLYKRLISELIDTIITILIKIVIFRIFGVPSIDFAEMMNLNLLDDDNAPVSTKVFVLGLIGKLITCLYEALFTARFGGSLGKLLVGMKIVQANAVTPLGQGNNHILGVRALIYPASTPTFARALLRALAKNLLVTLIPVHFMLYYRHNQLVHDTICKTVVVQSHPLISFRRRR